MFVAIDPLFAGHDPGPGHPERPERLLALLEVIRSFPYRDEIEEIFASPGSWHQASWIHDADYLGLLRRTRGSPAILDADTRTSADSVDIALAAFGSALAAAEKVSNARKPGFAMIRPPGHHAERDHAMGFCLFNNVAIVAEWALREAGAERVAVIDFDVHHGNGTQHSFYGRDDVLYISSHQFPLYPGTGALSEGGSGRGEGFTVNFPLPAGAGDPAFTRVYEDLVPRILEQFRPGWILISAGYDAHRDDPLAQMQVTPAGFARVVQSLQRCAQEYCDGRILYLLEGGYNLEALALCVSDSLKVMLGKLAPERAPLPAPAGWSGYLAEVRRAQPRWKL